MKSNKVANALGVLAILFAWVYMAWQFGRAYGMHHCN